MRISDWSSDVCSSDLLADLRFRPLVDFEHDIDAVLVERDHLGLDRRGEAALPLVELDNARGVGADFRSRVDLARRHLDLGTDLVFLKALVAFQEHAVDHRVSGDLDRQRTIFAVVLENREGYVWGKS